MTQLTSGNNGGSRSESGPARIDVPTIARAAASRAWQPTLQLLDQLAQLFPDDVVDVAEVHITEENQWPHEQS